MRSAANNSPAPSNNVITSASLNLLEKEVANFMLAMIEEEYTFDQDKLQHCRDEEEEVRVLQRDLTETRRNETSKERRQTLLRWCLQGTLDKTQTGT